MSLEERTEQLEHAFVMLVKLTQSMDERMDTHLSWINQLGEAQANSEAKIAALADGQINLADGLRNLADAQMNLADAQIKTERAVAALAERMSELAASQSHTDRRLDALIDIVREGRGGNSQG